MDCNRAESVLGALAEVYEIDDVQELVDRVCRHVARMGPWRVVLLSLYFGRDVYVGLEGGDEELRRRFFDVARRTPPERRARKRARIWARHRIPGTNICFIPEGSGIPFSASFRPSPERPEAEWRPEDRLMVFVRGMDGEVHGVLSLDEPVDGRRPDPAALGPLEAIDRFIALMGVLIHNRHLAAKLKESEERYAAVVEQGHDAIVIAREGRILFANRRLAEATGYRAAELVGRPVSEVIREEPRAALPGEQEGRLLARDGTATEVSLRSTTIRFGGSSATLLAAADISERRRLLTQLVRAQRMESVGTLASGIAHDFNNLLSGILGYASLLRGRVPPGSAAERHVRAIEKAGERAADLTQRLLSIARGERIRAAAFPPAQLLAELADLLGETSDPRVKIVVRCAPDAPEVLGDEGQIHQVLLNLCLNARDAMAEGGTLTLACERAGDGRVRLLVEDTGTGMDAATLSRVFDPFFSTKSGGSGTGTGLGLYMAYCVVERHGGTIDIQSRPGEGTTVEILLPAASPGPAAGAERARERARTVLIVDDEDLVRDMTAEMVALAGFEALAVPGGAEAVRAVQERGGELRAVVLDFAMPEMNGWEAAATIRRLAPDLPLLLVSGHEWPAAGEDLERLGGAAFLPKPYGFEELRRALESLLTPASSGSGTSDSAPRST